MSAVSYSMHRTTTTTSSSSHGGVSAGHAAEEFVASAEREKQEMQQLNSRLEVYISRVRQLEDRNKELVIELDTLRGSLGNDIGQIKFKFNDSLVKVRREISEAHSGTIGVEVKVDRLRDDLNDYRHRYEEARREVEREKTTWGGAISQAQAELDTNKSRYAAILDEEKRLYAEQDQLYLQLAAAKDELDAAIVDRRRLQAEEDDLKIELEFLGRIHSQEITELRTLLAQAPADTREFFKNELALAIREIKAEYDKIIQTTRVDLETIFQSKISAVESSIVSKNEAAVFRQEEIRKMNESITTLRAKLSELEARNSALEREANTLQIQLGEDQRAYESELHKRDNALRFMREDCQTLIAELQALLNTKQTLDTEIAIYRKLVESEEGRFTHVGQGVVVAQQETTRLVPVEQDHWDSGEVQTRSSFKRHAKGNVSIVECDPQGKYIILENTSGSVAEDVSNFEIRRVIDGVQAFVFRLPSHLVIQQHGHLKIYGRNSGGINSPPDSIVMESHPSWGQGGQVETFLYNSHGIEKASHIQTTVASSR
ncbi:Intermediate filament protein ifb-2 [Caenorhabditis elegans]|uniref:Intermediate filament protein ifb-2 n=1 Tax=Caenorhabditis elegans TaxID=6239 RepID=IFB2_CAEEL|nr:Intermediate filament protein ifb-2 [Caenorhabditis elegans]Q19286.1 RecName: Full=Intermediate filament protein ifb-2; AltName: Full=Cel IF B2; AltName: Full=Intermediate filament protein B2; Short=IF-B2 [Caenorhabditis elegans]CCD65033.1 Intermediate filament protein ifb-2 [Caenorhabditis elegans]|eukprot:NP_495133.1 Intermediate filament protein ifb-2 [Caenorhabditis elegans]